MTQEKKSAELFDPLDMNNYKVEKLPKIPYLFAVGLKDLVLVPSQHSDLMIERMVAAGHTVERQDYPEVAHCNLPHRDRIAIHKWLCEKMLEGHL